MKLSEMLGLAEGDGAAGLANGLWSPPLANPSATNLGSASCGIYLTLQFYFENSHLVGLFIVLHETWPEWNKSHNSKGELALRRTAEQSLNLTTQMLINLLLSAMYPA